MTLFLHRSLFSAVIMLHTNYISASALSLGHFNVHLGTQHAGNILFNSTSVDVLFCFSSW